MPVYNPNPAFGGEARVLELWAITLSLSLLRKQSWRWVAVSVRVPFMGQTNLKISIR